MRILDEEIKKNIRLMLQVDTKEAIAIAKALRAQATGIKATFSINETTQLLENSQIILSRISEELANYPGNRYEIWAKGKRTWLFGKREPDQYIGREYGRNFFEACNYHFTNVVYCPGAYNPKKNTLSGYKLYHPKNEGSGKKMQ